MTSQNGSYSYYLLLYGKASPVGSNGLYDVSIKTVLACTSGASFYSYNTSYNGKIDGSTAFSGTYAPSNAWELSSFTEGGVTYKIGTVLDEGSSYVDTGGSAQTITLSSTFSFKANGASYTPASGVSRTVTEYATLPATVVATKAILLTAPDFSDGENPTITYSNTSGNSVSALEACIGWVQGQDNIKYRAISKTKSSYTFELTDDEKEALRNACQNSSSLEVKFYLKTKIGSSVYYDVLTRTFTIANANPIVTGSVIDTNEDTIALTGDSSKLIKFYSHATATMTAEAQKGAAIDENLYIIRNGNQTGYGATHTFENVESNVFTFSAEDSRGNIGSTTVRADMINYIKLTCNITHDRLDLQGNLNFQCSGNYFNGSFGAEENTLTVQFRYAEIAGIFCDWCDMTVTIVGNGYYATTQLPGLDPDKIYCFEVLAQDKLMAIASANDSVKNMPIFHWGKDDFVFEVPVTFKAGIKDDSNTDANGDLNVTGDLRLKGSGNYGNYIRFGDADYCYIAELSDDAMTIKATRINLVADGVYVGNYPIPILDKGTWTPSLDSAAVSSYTTQYGWYSKMGQTVTVGFFIKANCNSGYQSTNVVISGLPFKPMFSASGGGMCARAYMKSGGQNFQCFVAETDNTITMRTQSCNMTAAGNLTTSASGVGYPTGGGELTLSGTITFMANS